ncbi:IS630 family transposase [Bradyrhizobium diazoefficiens]|nr:IS630 family transposase [Bradyrhizobium diazoefficiens]WLA67077.1 IS630 family transposase [Bradyrhizobium diazoefficiens]
MIPEAREVHLSRKDRKVLEACCRSPVTLQRDLKRARTLEVATGKIIATHSKRRRRVEFLDFMNSVTAAFPNRKLHVILDNLNTHKKNEDWLKAHPNVQFHFTPTSASWLNQVEVWFSILQGQSLSGTSFTSLKQLQEHIDAYVNAYNDRAEPFVWTKKKVRQRRFKGRRITQL